MCETAASDRNRAISFGEERSPALMGGGVEEERTPLPSRLNGRSGFGARRTRQARIHGIEVKKNCGRKRNM
jgi:hypothetical protein